MKIFLIALMSFSLYAQDGELSKFVEDGKNDLMVVLAGGGAGAILGLSTLSFVDEPSEHLSNIVTGAAVGIIAGVAYVVYLQATEGQGMVFTLNSDDAFDFSTKARSSWHTQELQKLNSVSGQQFAFNFAF